MSDLAVSAAPRESRPTGATRRRAALALAVAAAAAVSAALVFGLPVSVRYDSDVIRLFLQVGVVVLLLLGAVVARRIARLWAERRRGTAGARLHVRLVLLFGLVAVTPAIVVWVAAALYLNQVVDRYFGDNVRTAVKEAEAVAAAYLSEHAETIRADIQAMAVALSRNIRVVGNDPNLLAQLVEGQARARNLGEAMIFEGSGRVRVHFGQFLSSPIAPYLEPEAFAKANRGEIAVRRMADFQVRALMKVPYLVDSYLYVSRFMEPSVIGYAYSAETAASNYEELEANRREFQLLSGAVFGMVTLLLLMTAIWFGLTFATALSRPISGLIAAAERVRAGDLTARVPHGDVKDEMAALSQSFNRMTEQLEAQRRELVEANAQIDARRRFSEAVLAGVSAGVVGLDADGRIDLPNRFAVEMIGQDAESLIGRPFAEAMPEIAEVLEQAQRRTARPAAAEVRLLRANGVRTLLVRVVAEISGTKTLGYVVTFDDITELGHAQRKAAWADVARRIAHEIKNPLTPIQLSAERLKRKYLKEIESDPETFVNCTDTIVRQVEDIGRMVDEFSAFARMPAPKMGDADLREVCRHAILLQSTGRDDVAVDASLPADPVRLYCDARQIGQALTNLLQNAVDAIDGRAKDPPPEPGHVQVSIDASDTEIAVRVVDNGRGLPETHRDRLTEPYVTTRQKGTGLGLAIVKKIMEDHGGTVEIADRSGGGAEVSLVFRRQADDEAPAQPRTDGADAA